MDQPTRRLTPPDPPEPSAGHPTRRLDPLGGPDAEAVEHPTRRFDPIAPDAEAVEHPTRRLDPAAAPDLGATHRLTAAPPEPARCPRCQGALLGVRPVGRDAQRAFVGDVWVERARGAGRPARLEARMCTACGYAEFFAPPAAVGAPPRRLDGEAAAPAGPVPCAQCRDHVPVAFAGRGLSGGSYKVVLDQSGGWEHNTPLDGLACPSCGRCVLFAARPQDLRAGAAPFDPPRPCAQCAQPLLPVRYLDFLYRGPAYVVLQKRKHAPWHGPNFSPLAITTCTVCGYTELYATDPAELLAE